MSSSGSYRHYPVSGSEFGLYVEWEASQNKATMKSTITQRIYLKYYWLEVSACTGYSSINGTQQVIGSPIIKDYSSGTKTILLATQNVEITHDSEGYANNIQLVARLNMNVEYSGVHVPYLEASTIIDLDPIDVLPATITIPSYVQRTDSLIVRVFASAKCTNWRYKVDSGEWSSVVSTESTTRIDITIPNLLPDTEYSIQISADRTSNGASSESESKIFRTVGYAIIKNVTPSLEIDTATEILFDADIYNSDYTYTLIFGDENTTASSSGYYKWPNYNLQEHNDITITDDMRTDIMNNMTNMPSGPVFMVLFTYSNGVLLGDSWSGPIDISFSSGSNPEFTDFDVYDDNETTSSLIGTDLYFVADWSTLMVDITPAIAKNGATIKDYTISVGELYEVVSASQSLSGIEVGVPYTTGDIDILVTAIDSRGLQTSISKTIHVLEYNNISMSNAIVAKRVNSTSRLVTVSFSGSYSPLLVGSSYKNNTLLVSYQYKKTSEASYSQEYSSAPITDKNPSSGSYTYSNANLLSQQLDVDYSYDIRLIIRDGLTVTTRNVVIPQGIPLVSYRRKRVGINKENPICALDVVGDTCVQGQLSGGANSRPAIVAGSGTVILIDDDAYNDTGGHPENLENLSGTSWRYLGAITTSNSETVHAFACLFA